MTDKELALKVVKKISDEYGNMTNAARSVNDAAERLSIAHSLITSVVMSRFVDTFPQLEDVEEKLNYARYHAPSEVSYDAKPYSKIL